MIPRGLYGAAIPTAAPPPSGPTFLQATSTPSGSGTTHTFTEQSFGDEAAGRVILVAACAQELVTGVTVGGVTATSDILHTGGSSLRTSIWRATVPTGTSGTVVVTLGGSTNRCGIALWRSGTALTVVDTGSPLIGNNVTADAGDFVVASYYGTLSSITWSGGPIERYDFASPDLVHSGADMVLDSSGTITPGGLSGTYAAVIAAYSVA